jgi:dUTP pyrophosphatase
VIQVKKLNDDAIIPTYANDGDAGADLYSSEDLIINPGQWSLVKTGIAISMPKSFVGLVHPRSGMAAKFAVTVLNAPGTIDSGYRGEIMVNLINHGSNPFRVTKGDRIAQLIFQQYTKGIFISVMNELSDTDRGANGHGSTGV